MKERMYQHNFTASIIAALLMCTLLHSCDSEDLFGGNNSETACDYICFGVQGFEEDVTTRAHADAHSKRYTSDRYVLRTNLSADTLCVRSIVSEGIQMCATNHQPTTRGAAVTLDNFYDTFHVLAYWKKDGTLVQEQFYMDEDITQTGNNIWSSNQTYYWPGAKHTLQFFAWAPANVFTARPSTPADTQFSYQVPDEVTAQPDVVVAKPSETSGSYNAALPLHFEHICTQVRFALGNELQPGTIKQVAVRNVYNQGIYDMNTAAWTPYTNNTHDYVMAANKTTAEVAPDGELVLIFDDEESSLMMMPQTLPADARIEVVFHDDITGKDRTLQCSIAGATWNKGTTVTYKLSITPDYELEFVNQPEVQDAHYVIYPITIKADAIEGGWTLSYIGNDSHVTLRADLTDLEKQGYWIEEDRGTKSISGNANGEITVYAFIEENISNDTQYYKLELRPSNNPNAKAKTFTFAQLCPSWNGTIGCERIEDGTYQWGLSWDSDFKLIYDLTGCGSDQDQARKDLSVHIRWAQALNPWFPQIFEDLNYLDHEYSGGLWGGPIGSKTDKVTINFGRLEVQDIAILESDGLANSKEIYNYNGLSQIADIIARIENISGYKVTTSGNGTFDGNFAVRVCAKLNKYNKKTVNDGEAPYLSDENFVWYLPSKNEILTIADNEYPLSGDYWSSTSVQGTTNKAYKRSGETTAEELRTTSLHVRAVRAKP